MPKRYDMTLRMIAAEDRDLYDITSPRYQWPPYRRAFVQAGRVGDGKHIGDVFTIGSQRVCVLAVRRMPYGYLVAPDSPGVGFTVLVRALGRSLRRANLGLLLWLYANDWLITPEYCDPHWSEVRIPWRRG